MGKLSKRVISEESIKLGALRMTQYPGSSPQVQKGHDPWVRVKFNTQRGDVGDLTSNLQVTGRPALPPELSPPCEQLETTTSSACTWGFLTPSIYNLFPLCFKTSST